MAFLDMAAELSEAIPGLSRIYSKTLINRAWRVVRDSNLWSFQLGQGGFATPPLTNVGSVTVTINSPIVVGDATASAAWQALSFPFRPSVQQFRVTQYTIYNIIAFDGVSTLTLDRPFIDPLSSLSNVGYQMLLAYIPAPVKHFKRWLSVMDMFDCYSLDIWTSRRDVNIYDPTRFQTSNPECILPLGTDQRPGSSTLGWMLYELWPNPTTPISYMTYYAALGDPLEANTDELPYPITQDVVLSKARTYAYEWAESRKDVMAAKGSGANYLALKEDAEESFLARLKSLRLLDRDQVDSFMTQMRVDVGRYGRPYYNSVSGRAGMGRY